MNFNFGALYQPAEKARRQLELSVSDDGPAGAQRELSELDSVPVAVAVAELDSSSAALAA